MEHPTRLTIAQAARALGMSERTLRRRVTDGKIKAVKAATPETGVAWFIEQTTLDTLLNPQPGEEEQEKEDEPASRSALARVEPQPELERNARAPSAEIVHLRGEVQQIKAFLLGQTMAESGEQLPANLGTVIGQAMRETLAPMRERIEEQSAENALLKQQLAKALEHSAQAGARKHERRSPMLRLGVWWPFSRR